MTTRNALKLAALVVFLMPPQVSAQSFLSGDWVNFYHEDAADLYPTDAVLQQMRAQLPIEAKGPLGTQFPEFDRVGLYGRILLNVEYDVERHWTVMGHLSAQFATQFS